MEYRGDAKKIWAWGLRTWPLPLLYNERAMTAFSQRGPRRERLTRSLAG